MPCAQGQKTEIASIEMSGASVSLVLTQGAINIWFGRNIQGSLVRKIIATISKVDSTTEHEREVHCRFDQISEFEANGYILTSYARKGETYRAIFVVPFSNQRALEMFTDSILEELQRQERRITLYWRGGRIRMKIAKDDLEGLGCFTAVNITPKEEGQGTESRSA